MSDGESWVSVSGLAIGVISAAAGGAAVLAGGFIKSLVWASKEGKQTGALLEWRKSVDEKIAAGSLQTKESEFRTNARIDYSEIRMQRLEEKFERVALKSDVDAGFDRIERQLRDISDYMHERHRDRE